MEEYNIHAYPDMIQDSRHDGQLMKSREKLVARLSGGKERDVERISLTHMRHVKQIDFDDVDMPPQRVSNNRIEPGRQSRAGSRERNVSSRRVSSKHSNGEKSRNRVGSSNRVTTVTTQYSRIPNNGPSIVYNNHDRHMKALINIPQDNRAIKSSLNTPHSITPKPLPGPSRPFTLADYAISHTPQSINTAPSRPSAHHTQATGYHARSYYGSHVAHDRGMPYVSDGRYRVASDGGPVKSAGNARGMPSNPYDVGSMNRTSIR